MPIVRKLLLTAAGAAIMAAVPVSAAVMTFTSTFEQLNSLGQVDAGNGDAPILDGFVGSTASGTSTVTVDTDALTIRIRINATGLEAGIPHLSHIHGNLAGGPMAPGSGAVDSTIPTLAQDADGDGFIEVAEGQATYGPILLDLMNVDPDLDGTVAFDMTFDLNDPMTFAPVDRFNPDGARFGITDLLGDDLVSLALRHIVVHGLTVPFEMGNAGAAPNEIDGSTTLLPVCPQDCPGGIPDPFEGSVALPVLNGEFAEVPEPAAVGLLGLGILGLGIARRRRKA